MEEFKTTSGTSVSADMAQGRSPGCTLIFKRGLELCSGQFQRTFWSLQRKNATAHYTCGLQKLVGWNKGVIQRTLRGQKLQICLSAIIGICRGSENRSTTDTEAHLYRKKHLPWHSCDPMTCPDLSFGPVTTLFLTNGISFFQVC